GGRPRPSYAWLPWRAGEERSSSSCCSSCPRGRAATSPYAGRSRRRASWSRPRAAPAWSPRTRRSSSPRSIASRGGPSASASRPPLVDGGAEIVGLVHGGARCHIATPAGPLARLVDHVLGGDVVETTRAGNARADIT